LYLGVRISQSLVKRARRDLAALEQVHGDWSQWTVDSAAFLACVQEYALHELQGLMAAIESSVADVSAIDVLLASGKLLQRQKQKTANDQRKAIDKVRKVRCNLVRMPAAASSAVVAG
jgi:hypothetical protein